MAAPENPTDDERAALLRFEALYEAWRLANERALEVEKQLWMEVLTGGDETRRRALSAESAVLRAQALALYEQVLAAQRERD